MVRYVLIAAFVVLFAGVSLQRALASDVPAVGTEAPDFTLSSQEGKPVNLRDFKGKWVVLYFYPKDFTSGCTLEAHNFQRDLEKYEKANAVILGVSVDSAGSQRTSAPRKACTSSCSPTRTRRCRRSTTRS